MSDTPKDDNIDQLVHNSPSEAGLGDGRSDFFQDTHDSKVVPNLDNGIKENEKDTMMISSNSEKETTITTTTKEVESLFDSTSGFSEPHMSPDSYINQQIALLFKPLERDADDDDNNAILVRMNSTRILLDDAQSIGFVSLCRVSLEAMIRELVNAESRYRAGKKSLNSKDKKLITVLKDCLGSMKFWSHSIMVKLYKQMGTTADEQLMVEQLADHGVEPQDLARSLIDLSGEIVSEKTITTDTTGDTDHNNKIDIRWALICDLFLLLTSESVYDSRSRTLLQRIGSTLRISELEIARFEKGVTELLANGSYDGLGDGFNGVGNDDNGQQIMKSREKMNKTKKSLYLGAAAVGGGLVIGLSAGLLAPVIGAGLIAGLGGVGIGGISGIVAGTGGVAMITATGTAIGAKIGLDGMSKRMGDIKTFSFKPFHMASRANLIVTIPGWMSSEIDDVRLPFSTVDPVMGDLYSLLWEPEMLQSTGNTFTVMAQNWLFKQGMQEVLRQTVMGALMASIKIPMALTKLGYLIDNPWHVSLDRAWSCGKLLADTLLQRNLGVRPVTLVGFSLGSRVIYSCLLELARQGGYGLVQDVYLFGTPIAIKQAELALALTVVSGKLINGYSRKDWILGYLFRTSHGGLGKVAGLAPIKDCPEWTVQKPSAMSTKAGHADTEYVDEDFNTRNERSGKLKVPENPATGIINFDCSEYVGGHKNYRVRLPLLLKKLGWEVLSEEFQEAVDLNKINNDSSAVDIKPGLNHFKSDSSYDDKSQTYVNHNQEELMRDYTKARQGMDRKENISRCELEAPLNTFTNSTASRKVPDIFDEFDDYDQTKSGENSGIFNFFKSTTKPKPKPVVTPADNREVLFDLSAIKEGLEDMNEESSQYDWLIDNDDDDDNSYVVPIDHRSSSYSSNLSKLSTVSDP